MTAHLATWTVDDAERLTARITLLAGTFRDSMDKLAELVDRARETDTHTLLGYSSWTAYLSDVLGRSPFRLDAPQRKELVSYLAGEGMSTRAIAPIVGVTDRTISADIKAQVRSDFAPAPVRVDAATGEITETTTGAAFAPAPVVPAAVIGLDGKSYTRPAPAAVRAPARRPITDAFDDATSDVTKAVERLVRLTEDDRFSRNADQVAVKNHSDLIRASEALARVLDRLTTTPKGTP